MGAIYENSMMPQVISHHLKAGLDSAARAYLLAISSIGMHRRIARK